MRTHEETGRKSLYANPTHIVRIQGLGDAESEKLIAELTDHMVATKAQYRHKWQVGDIVIWDNRCALHSATGGYPIEEKRIHWRVTIMQDAARGTARGMTRIAALLCLSSDSSPVPLPIRRPSPTRRRARTIIWLAAPRSLTCNTWGFDTICRTSGR